MARRLDGRCDVVFFNSNLNKKNTMKEYWEITLERLIATCAVWGINPTFALKNLTLTSHSTAIAGLTDAANLRALKEGDLSDKRALRDNVLGVIKDVIVRVPGIIGNKLEDGDDLQDQLDLVFSVSGPFTETSALRRSGYLFGLWADFNALLAAQVPAQTPLTLAVTGNPAMDLGAFMSLCSNFAMLRSEVQTAEREVNKAKTALRALESKTDRGNKRWYGAWMKQFPEGTPEGDAALSQIPTEQGTAAPTPLEINSLTPQVDHTVAVLFQDGTGLHGTTKELLYRLPGEAEFGHSTPVTLPSQSIGPFPPGTIVEVRTRLANSTPGVVLGTVKSVLV